MLSGMVRTALLLFVAGAVLTACSDDETQTTSGGGAAPGGTGGVPNGGSGGAGAGGTGGAGGQGGAGGSCQSSLPNEASPPETLSATGLYSDIADKTLAAYVEEFSPQFPLWTDGAVKTRWVYLPECDPVIDNGDEDVWSFPVGTRMWKQFERDDELIETRMIHRFGPGADDFILVAYRWNEDNTEATRVPLGELDAKGTEHDIPTEEQCTLCHGNGIAFGGTPSRFLGFSAIQLSHDGAGATMASLSSGGHLSVPKASGYTVPGDAVERAALGYLHANCASCHNSTVDGLFTVNAKMQLRAADMAVNETLSFTTLVDEDPLQFSSGTCDKLIDGDAPENSCVVERMNVRGPDDDPGTLQMPPLGTAEIDTSGVDAVTAWIESLP